MKYDRIYGCLAGVWHKKITVKKCMTLYVTSCMTQNMGAIFLQKRVYDTKVYDTKCTTKNNLAYTNPVNVCMSWE